MARHLVVIVHIFWENGNWNFGKLLLAPNYSFRPRFYWKCNPSRLTCWESMVSKWIMTLMPLCRCLIQLCSALDPLLYVQIVSSLLPYCRFLASWSCLLGLFLTCGASHRMLKLLTFFIYKEIYVIILLLLMHSVFFQYLRNFGMV